MAAEIEGADPRNEDRKSKKKKKKNRKIESEDGDITDGEEPKKEKSNRKKKEKKKKRKAFDEERSDTSSDAGEPVGHQAVANGSALKKPTLVEKNCERQDEGMGGGDGNPNAVSNSGSPRP